MPPIRRSTRIAKNTGASPAPKRGPPTKRSSAPAKKVSKKGKKVVPVVSATENIAKEEDRVVQEAVVEEEAPGVVAVVEEVPAVQNAIVNAPIAAEADEEVVEVPIVQKAVKKVVGDPGWNFLEAVRGKLLADKTIAKEIPVVVLH